MQTLSQILEVLADERLTDNMPNADVTFVRAMRDLAMQVQRVDAEQRRLRGLIADFDGHVKELKKLQEKVNGMDTAIESLQDDIKQASDAVDSLQNSMAATDEEEI